MKINRKATYCAAVFLLFGCQKQYLRPMGSATTTEKTVITTELSNNAPGWASYGGICNGGATGTEVVVNNLAGLMSAISQNAAVIKINSNITITSRIEVAIKSNMTIYGAPGVRLKNLSTTVAGSGIFRLSGCTNMIIRNLIFEGPGAYDTDGGDNLSLINCKRIWVDHCEFQDAVDGNLDITNGSDYVTVTYCKFIYLKTPIPGGSGGMNDHRFSNLIGNSDSQTGDIGKLHVTFARCWWSSGCRERLPRVRFGKIHILNCFYNCSGNNYCIGTGKQSDIRVENTLFKGVKNPFKAITADWTAYQNIGCSFVNCTGNTTGAGTAFALPYTISTLPVMDVETAVTAGAGATLTGNVSGF